MRSASDVLREIGARMENIIWAFGLHAFTLIILFIFIDFIIGGFVFYKNALLAGKEEPAPAENIIKFNEKEYQKVLEELQKREQGNEEPPASLPE